MKTLHLKEMCQHFDGRVLEYKGKKEDNMV